MPTTACTLRLSDTTLPSLIHPQQRGAQYFYLYVILDIFSRYVTGWMVAERETAGLAGRLIEEGCLKHGVQPRVLTLHSDSECLRAGSLRVV